MVVEGSFVEATVTVQEYDSPGVSLVTEKALQPLSLQNVSPAGIDHENDTSTLVVNQPLHPPAAPAGVQTVTIVGGSRLADPAETEAGRTSTPTTPRSKPPLRSKATSRPGALIAQPESVEALAWLEDW
jgi:hypothetical protein